ncbi:prenyltransferase/squalene oxidase repeat-containing protein [Streptomyces aidingensis]|uniref:Prenyltransferase and squalene oxidase repeat-containing protein n=1 Tax=Streptomyces aidingensis TaxID=910347 RepID=A0A1I1LC03_9ACTN|nr:prenyltransferase/squalene oxidase repeat-containing protein [Streptomyces aidingensis]SFC67903.1 Prenyltransferase and squalene oxidase repeat-containing protein [Streptomyces aidingensis]
MNTPRTRRRTAAGLAVAAVALLPFAGPGAPGAHAHGSATEGLYGDGDATWDGVWRQSWSLLALHSAGITPHEEAVHWLTGQQCEDGAFPAYRADTEQPCGDDTPRDTNATAAAVQALHALGGHEQQMGEALVWLLDVQNEDGGWPYNPGGATDANSTAVVLGAFTAVGDPGYLEEIGTLPDALAALQLGCDAEEAQRGAFAWQPEADGSLFANDLATVDAVLAAHGSGLLVEPADPAGDGAAAPRPLECDPPRETDGAPRADAEAGAAYLAARLAAGDGHLNNDLTDGQPDYLGTAKAVMALAAGGHRAEIAAPLEWLRQHHGEWAGYQENPTALAALALTAHAAGADARDFGGTDLIAALAALGPEPQTPLDEVPEDTATDDGKAAEGDADAGTGTGAGDGQEDVEEEDSGSLLWLLGIGLLAGAGIGLLLALRGRGTARNGDTSGSADADADGNGDGNGDSGNEPKQQP